MKETYGKSRTGTRILIWLLSQSSDTYKLLTSVVMPRPIAWIVSRDLNGNVNAAPLLFFQYAFFGPTSGRHRLLRCEGPSTPRIRSPTSAYTMSSWSNMGFPGTCRSHEHHRSQRAGGSRRDTTWPAPCNSHRRPWLMCLRIESSPVALECKLFQIRGTRWLEHHLPRTRRVPPHSHVRLRRIWVGSILILSNSI